MEQNQRSVDKTAETQGNVVLTKRNRVDRMIKSSYKRGFIVNNGIFLLFLKLFCVK